MDTVKVYRSATVHWCQDSTVCPAAWESQTTINASSISNTSNAGGGVAVTVVGRMNSCHESWSFRASFQKNSPLRGSVRVRNRSRRRIGSAVRVSASFHMLALRIMHCLYCLCCSRWLRFLTSPCLSDLFMRCNCNSVEFVLKCRT